MFSCCKCNKRKAWVSCSVCFRSSELTAHYIYDLVTGLVGNYRHYFSRRSLCQTEKGDTYLHTHAGLQIKQLRFSLLRLIFSHEPARGIYSIHASQPGNIQYRWQNLYTLSQFLHTQPHFQFYTHSLHLCTPSLTFNSTHTLSISAHPAPLSISTHTLSIYAHPASLSILHTLHSAYPASLSVLHTLSILHTQPHFQFYALSPFLHTQPHFQSHDLTWLNSLRTAHCKVHAKQIKLRHNFYTAAYCSCWRIMLIILLHPRPKSCLKGGWWQSL